MIFKGRHEHTLDAKGRVFIPAEYRGGLGQSFVVTRAFRDPCLWVFSQETFEALSAKMEDFSLLDASTQSLERILYNSACDVEPDKQGRIVLTQDLRQYAGLTKDVIITGSRNRLEIWDKDAWTAQHERDLEAFSQTLQTLQERGVKI